MIELCLESVVLALVVLACCCVGRHELQHDAKADLMLLLSALNLTLADIQ